MIIDPGCFTLFCGDRKTISGETNESCLLPVARPSVTKLLPVHGSGNPDYFSLQNLDVSHDPDCPPSGSSEIKSHGRVDWH